MSKTINDVYGGGGSYEPRIAELERKVGDGEVGTIADVFRENSATLLENYTLVTGKNASAVGPIIVDDGVVITVEDGARLVIL